MDLQVSVNVEPTAEPESVDDSRRPKQVRKASREQQLFTCSVVVLLFSALVVTAALVTGHWSASRVRVCPTTDCQRHATELTRRLVGAASPCDDWSRFVCSAWENEHPGADSALDDAAMHWSSRMASVVPEQVYYPPEARKAVHAIVSCLDRSLENATESTQVMLDFLDRRIRETKAMSDRRTGSDQPYPAVASLMAEVVDYAVNWMLPLLFNVALLAVHGPPTGRIIVLFPSELVPVWLKVVTEQRQRGTYDSTWKYISRATIGRTTHFDLDNGADIAEDVLSSLHKVTEFEPEASAVVTIGKLGKILGLPPGKNLVQAFSQTFVVSPEIDENDVVFVSHRRLLVTLTALVDSHGADALIAFMRWWVLVIVGFLADSNSTRQHASDRDTNEMITLVCTTEVEATYGLALNRADKENFEEEELDSIRKALENIRNTLVQGISRLVYLEDSAKENITVHLKSLKTELWSDVDNLKEGNESLPVFADFPVADGPFLKYWLAIREYARSLKSAQRYRLSYVQRRTTPNTLVHYEPFSKTVILNHAALTPPYYYPEGSKAMFYGGIGFWYAKTLVQALDYEYEGLFTPEDEDAAVLPSPVYKGKGLLKRCSDGFFHRDEFPDMAAMEVAHAALQRDDDYNRLPGAETLDTDHIFFMTLCYGACRAEGKNRFSPTCDRAVMKSPIFIRLLRCKSELKLCGYF
ncbi:endothelin-converting enzyme 2-like [Dermacentor albipictus]|uniref:endothelin-converting enzyme 2-like n=1 Tax=Dermacentor albipictus TaxID=60249 RepID=UPI0038FCC3D9